jgi:acetyl esterase/lipase
MGFAAALFLLAQQAPFPKKTHVYKEAGGVRIELDVHRPADDAVRPVLVWIHGGALILGSRAGVPRNLLDLARAEGYALVSIDYRLAPQVKAPDIVADLKDAFRWIREKGPELEKLDPRKLVVAGGSAGGYLTLMSGFCVEPRPTALVAYWGYGDLDGDWYTKPSEHYRKQPIADVEEARKALASEVVTAPPNPEQAKARSRYYLSLRQAGLWTREVAGLAPGKELDPYCPVRNVSPAWPPTLLVHGTEDTDVPHDRSEAMAREFEKHRVPHEFVSVPGAGHGLPGGDPKLVADAHARALAFIKKHLR